MRFESILKITTTAAICGLGGTASGSLLRFDGSSSADWHTAANWTDVTNDDSDDLPDADDVVLIPDATFGGPFNVTITSQDATAYEINTNGTSTLTVNGHTLTLVGPSDSVIAGANGLVLKETGDNAAALVIDIPGGAGTHIFAGAGSVLLDDADLDTSHPMIQVVSGDVLENEMTVHGKGYIAGPGTFYNQGVVLADQEDNELVMASNLLLNDDDTGGTDSIWRVNGSGSELVFQGNVTLDGDVYVWAGTLSIEADVSFTGGTDAALDFDAGSIFVLTGKTFTYDNFALGSSCSNPDGSGPPYSLSAGTYNCS